MEQTKSKEMSDTDWGEIQKRAASTIKLTFASDVRYKVLKESTQKEIWDKLTSIYASNSLTNRLNFKMKLYSYWTKKVIFMITLVVSISSYVI